MRVLWHLVSGCSSRRLCEDRVGQGYIQWVVVLDQRGVFVVQDQVFQGTIEVVGLSKSKTCGRLVNHAMLDLSIHSVEKEEHVLCKREILRKCRSQLGKKTLKNLTIPIPIPLTTSVSINDSFKIFKIKFRTFWDLNKMNAIFPYITNWYNFKINHVNLLLSLKQAEELLKTCFSLIYTSIKIGLY